MGKGGTAGRIARGSSLWGLAPGKHGRNQARWARLTFSIFHGGKKGLCGEGGRPQKGNREGESNWGTGSGAFIVRGGGRGPNTREGKSSSSSRTHKPKWKCIINKVNGDIAKGAIRGKKRALWGIFVRRKIFIKGWLGGGK